jgi:hypothetical protein
MLKKILRKLHLITKNWLYENIESLPSYQHDRYVDTVSMFLKLTKQIEHCYAWGAIQGALLAKRLGIDKISFIEFGVAGGNGLIALENISIFLEKEYSIKIDVYGFDTSAGLPKSKDYRDLPHILSDGDFCMDVEKLKSRLKKAQLILGLVKDTISDFITSIHAPVAFISYDMDLYTSTNDGLKLLNAEAKILLPRIHCFFDDIFSCGDFDGERLSILEFNQKHETRKISRIYGLNHLVPIKVANRMFWEKYYMAYIFDHDLFSKSECFKLTSLALRDS